MHPYMHVFPIKIKTFLLLMGNKVGVKVDDKLIVIGLCCSLQKEIKGNVENDLYIAKLFLLNVIFKTPFSFILLLRIFFTVCLFSQKFRFTKYFLYGKIFNLGI